MTLSDYQTAAWRTAVYRSTIGPSLVYAALGLNGEAGEVADEAKKVMRDDGCVLTEHRRERIAAELGDVLWYVAAVASELGIDLGTIAGNNLEKLESRAARGTLHGSGDSR